MTLPLGSEPTVGTWRTVEIAGVPRLVHFEVVERDGGLYRVTAYRDATYGLRVREVRPPVGREIESEGLTYRIVEDIDLEAPAEQPGPAYWQGESRVSFEEALAEVSFLMAGTTPLLEDGVDDVP